MTHDPEKLVQRWSEVYDGADKAIGWIKEVRETAPRLDQEAEGLIEKMRRVRNLSRRLGAASARPMAVGFFGLSQAGKSYLISSLAAGENGQLETVFDGERLNFIDHVNPPGGGKEATGLVTRFTRQAEAPPAGFPLRLTMLSEVDVAKILGNSFFNDFDREKVIHNVSADYIRDFLKKIEPKKQAQPTGGIDEDDAIDLLDYFDHRFKKSMEPLKGDYWPSVVELAPYLAPEDRAQLLSILWGEIPQLTNTYLSFRSALASISFAPAVYAPMSALVTPLGDGKYSQADSIINVDILRRLGAVDDDKLNVRPKIGDEVLSDVAIPRALLAALTTEMAFPLVEKPISPTVDSVDLLDFPGYRGRMNMESIEKESDQVDGGEPEIIASIILRGKVAYLFEQYTDNQEMNGLIVCTASHKQSDITDVGPVLTSWIDATQGATPEARAGRKSGLLWAITMFDVRIGSSLGQTEDVLQLSWDGMMTLTMLEKFGGFEWMNEWSPGQPFDRVMLVRKPGFVGTSFLSMEGTNELALNPDHQAQLDLMRKTFSADEKVQKHINSCEEAWDAMLSLNDGGMARLDSHLSEVADLQFKLSRIAEQLDETTNGLVDSALGRFFQREGAGETEVKRKQADEVIQHLKQRVPFVGELLSRFEPSPELLRSTYMRSDAMEPETPEEEEKEGKETSAASSGALSASGMIDLSLDGMDMSTDASAEEVDEGGDDAPRKLVSAEDRFAQAAMIEWIKHMREMVDDDQFLSLLGFEKQAVETIVDEMVTGADRYRLEQRLRDVTSKAELSMSTARGRLVERQVFAARTVFADYIAELGNEYVELGERQDSEAVKGRKLFQPSDRIPVGDMPSLPEKPFNYSALYLLDWMAAFRNLAVGNAGHSAGREISPEQNAELGRILSLIQGRDLVSADGTK